MKTFTLDDGTMWTGRDWFLARITRVCDRTGLTCTNFPCSWQQYYVCDNASALTEDSTDLIYGDCATGDNVAYPISETAPAVGDVVTMRYRGSYVDADTGDTRNVFEFIGGSLSTVLAMTALQCSGDVLSATFSEGCEAQ